MVANTGAPILTPQTITFPALPASVPSTSPSITLAATASSGLPVVYSVTSGPATVSGSTLSLTGAAGTVTVAANQAGNSIYAAAPPVSQQFTVVASTTGTTPQTITFPTIAGLAWGSAPLTLQATSSSGLPITYTATGAATVTGSILSLTGAGPASVTATQPGNLTYAPATAVQQSFVVATAPLTVTASNTTITAGSAIPTSFAYSVAGFVYQDNQSVVSGAPAFTVSANQNSPVGTYPIVPSIGTLAAPNYSFVFVNGTLTISGIQSTTTALTASATSAAAGQPVTFTATVTPSSPGTPTGTVTFTGGGISAPGNTGTLSAGVATFTTAALNSGADAVVATYSGDSSYSGSVSAPVQVTIAGPTFTFAANTSGISIKSGQSGSVVLTVTPVDNYTGAVVFNCGDLPQGLSCNFTPSKLTISGSAASQGTLTINTNGLASLTAPMPGPLNPVFAVISLPFGLAGSFLAFGKKRLYKGDHVPGVLVFLSLLTALCGLVACTSGQGTPQASAGLKTITITATDPTSLISQTITLSVTVR
jgi:hypothetical protein